MRRPACLVFLLLSITNHATSSQESSATNNNTLSDLSNANECTLYMAPSSIPGAGLGLFTTRNVAKGERILPYSGTDAPHIVVCDANHFDIKKSDWLHYAYFWSGVGYSEFECDKPSESVVTFGAITNFHTYLANVKGTNYGYDDEAADRFRDPSAGAFSYHEGHSFKSDRIIKAGDEIFTDYGEAWLDAREGTFADSVPRYDDFVKAGSILHTMRDNFIETAVEVNDDVLSLIKGATEVFDGRVASLIPDKKARYDILTEHHLDEENYYADVIARESVMKRGVSWIKENGLCMDNILPGKSTIPFVGKGAFANRFLAEGNIVSPVPLLQILDRDILLTYEVNREEESEYVDIGSEPIGKQLLINYCFGHKDSKILLCPQSNAILINHCSSRNNGAGHCGIKGPNAKIQWASGWDPNTPLWLEMSLDRMSEVTAESSRGLSFEVIATRDINKGEEIFIDYGSNWEDAWELHKDTWTPPEKGSRFGNYNPVEGLIGNILLRTVDELAKDPYPDNIVNSCFWYEYVEEGYDPNEMGYYMADDYIFEGDLKHSVSLWECDVLKKISDSHYEVRILRRREGKDDVLLTMFPRESITFIMKRYTSDQHLPGAFRHYIEIDDNIFPEQWKIGYTDVEEP